MRKLQGHSVNKKVAQTHEQCNFLKKKFFCNIGSFHPLCVRSPLDTLESGVLFHIWWLSKQLLVLHDSPPWKVALCLPYPTMPSPPRSQAWGGTINYETL